MQTSQMAETLIGSEIIRLAAEINALKKGGKKIFNFTIGDFDPDLFPIPEEFRLQIIRAYEEHHTNYPAANGIPELRKSVSAFLKKYFQLDYTDDEILIACGARPLIYAIYSTILDPGDKVIYPIPSWNNNHYCHLARAEKIEIETLAQNNFMPSAAEIEPAIGDASLISLCSPLNPTGTVFSEKQLDGICSLVIEENKQREGKRKPVYVLYDQIYSMLTFRGHQHLNPVRRFPELRPYTIFVDGMSKAFAATGVRVGWSFGPEHVMEKMKSILSHVGAWAPKAEQVAAARYLAMEKKVDDFLTEIRNKIDLRLEKMYTLFSAIAKNNSSIKVIEPQAAIYLTVCFDLCGYQTENGNVLQKQNDVREYLLEKSGLAIVPFSAFGTGHESPWYRVSIGTFDLAEFGELEKRLTAALSALKEPAKEPA